MDFLRKMVANEERPHSMTVLYYPTYPEGEEIGGRLFNFSHMKVAVNDVVYNTTVEFTELGQQNAIERLARMQFTKGFIEYTVELTESEFQRAQNLVRGNSEAGILCHDGVCQVLQEAADFRVPQVFQILPSYVGIYLALNHLVGGRVTSLRYVGKNGVVSLMSTNLALEATMTTAIIGPGLYYLYDLLKSSPLHLPFM